MTSRTGETGTISAIDLEAKLSPKAQSTCRFQLDEVGFLKFAPQKSAEEYARNKNVQNDNKNDAVLVHRFSRFSHVADRIADFGWIW